MEAEEEEVRCLRDQALIPDRTPKCPPNLGIHLRPLRKRLASADSVSVIFACFLSAYEVHLKPIMTYPVGLAFFQLGEVTQTWFGVLTASGVRT